MGIIQGIALACEVEAATDASRNQVTITKDIIGPERSFEVLPFLTNKIDLTGRSQEIGCWMTLGSEDK